MALTRCRKCGVWTRSTVCGACGAPVSDTGKLVAPSATGNITLGQGLFGLALLVLIVVVVVWSDQAPPGDRARAAADYAAPTRSYTPEEREAAQDVMSNARQLCNIYEEALRLVVECRLNIPTEQRLDFAVAIANADALLTGKARNIDYYLPGGAGVMFAQADPVRGIRLK